MQYILIALGIGLLVSLIGGIFIIPFLQRLKFGQEIREEGPVWHQKKSGTPTIGALIFLLGSTIAVGSMLYLNMIDQDALAVFICALFFGFIGFVDDYIKVVKKRNLGLRAAQKFSAQVLVSMAFSLYLYTYGITQMIIPFTNISIDLGYYFIPFAVFIMIAVVNAVNLTDGLDGLAGSTTIVTMAFFGYAAYKMGYYGMTLVLAAVIGGVLGFLFYNFYPAKVFMGDTGSLFLGGIICCAALSMGLELFIIIAGGVYLMETLSVILQVFYFKITHGKRLFKMSPIHHHFEMMHWSEIKIVSIFVIATIILCYISLLGL